MAKLASGCQLLSGNKAFLVECSFHGAAKSLRVARVHCVFCFERGNGKCQKRMSQPS